MPFDGDLLVADPSNEVIAVLDPDGEIVVIKAEDGTSMVLDDEMQLLDHLSDPAYQEALTELRDARARRRSGS